jgi:hypothetical protein
MTDGKFKILSFRSRDQVFKADPGVVPDDEICRKAGITVIRTAYQHNELSDRGPNEVKAAIQAILDKFLSEDDAAPPAAADTKPPAMTGPAALAASAIN